MSTRGKRKRRRPLWISSRSQHIPSYCELRDRSLLLSISEASRVFPVVKELDNGASSQLSNGKKKQEIPRQPRTSVSRRVAPFGAAPPRDLIGRIRRAADSLLETVEYQISKKKKKKKTSRRLPLLLLLLTSLFSHSLLPRPFLLSIVKPATNQQKKKKEEEEEEEENGEWITRNWESEDKKKRASNPSGDDNRRLRRTPKSLHTKPPQ